MRQHVSLGSGHALLGARSANKWWITDESPDCESMQHNANIADDLKAEIQPRHTQNFFTASFSASESGLGAQKYGAI